MITGIGTKEKPLIQDNPDLYGCLGRVKHRAERERCNYWFKDNNGNLWVCYADGYCRIEP